jgi:hypothetical protein
MPAKDASQISYNRYCEVAGMARSYKIDESKTKECGAHGIWEFI